GKKAYEQAAGFIRIKNGKNIFDSSGIHPESYEVAKKLDLDELKSLDIRTKAGELGVGFETLSDIIKELIKPGFDPREELPGIVFKKGLTNIEMLKEGSLISGIVRNITDFGAFVDIGLKNDGMIHISKMSEKRIKHPFEVLSINQHLPNIRVVSVDFKTQKVELSLI
ncbi:MAG: S1 RNA-binding domain-containing protein, partial [Sulfurimonas sp.]|nr:S1 RNA-binding domain-containing protein [Sulfurimonas sp.]